MEESQKIRIALIGLGDIAQKAYLPIAANHSKVEPILCTRNKKVLEQLAIKYHIDSVFTDIDELIKTRPDAAMVHSSTESHYLYTSKLLNAGIPIFVDKPLSYSLHESEKLLNLATQKQLLLYLGFNRRFAPLIQSLKQEESPVQVFWQKNRVNLPGDPRAFVFDDFIHVVDSLLFLAKGPIENINIFSKLQNNKLESLQVQWQQNGTLLNGTMNRISGVTEERVEYYSNGNKWEINELVSGFHYKNNIQHIIKFDNWKSTLYKRGFIDLFEDWLLALSKNQFDANRIQDIWNTHSLCESIVGEIL
ncbi:Gfo/Idh/MocA family protein [Flavivirga spongiicola]|uniref:Gfo/Idh/MocA family oxidoreductase n=1 Tax=Flavivirga spongiicola TaxID=421621 RepID=A0ABU7XQR2_9FLAO|nr:Gfo/Idh/MocA family oxidoreductase [Flavivirga sp. MEBiC05379]MDO5978085.1 Gfo/Idh/MocA family oxidoreductase [Flavivirga sp. MEBiC05379]